MPNTLEALIGVGGAGVGAIALKLAQSWLAERAKRPSPSRDAADLVTAAATFQEALNEAAGGVIAGLVANQQRLEAEIEELKRENEQCRTEGEQLRQQSRGLEQRVDSLLRQLRDPASTQPGGSLSGALIEIADGDVKVTRPRRRKT